MADRVNREVVCCNGGSSRQYEARKLTGFNEVAPDSCKVWKRASGKIIFLFEFLWDKNRISGKHHNA